MNVSSRFGGVDYGSTKLMGLNNIELITDRPLEVNLREMADVKKQYPSHTLVASLMVDTKEEWSEIIKKVEDVGSDLIELNFGCPHGMCERGMGSAVGAEPKVLEAIVGWVMETANIPVIVKLTPNVGDITEPAAAAYRAGADAVSLINTVKSIVGVDLDRMVPMPVVGDGSSNGGYCGPAVKPIAAPPARPDRAGLPEADQRDRRHLQLARRGGVHGPRLDERAGLHRGHAHIPHRGGHDRGPERLPRRQGHGLGDGPRGQGQPRLQGVGRPRPQLPHRRQHRPRELHRLPALRGRLPRRLAPVHPRARGERRGQEEARILALPEGRLDVAALAEGAWAGARVLRVHEAECVGCNLCQLVCPVEGTIKMVEKRKALERQTWNDRVVAGTDVTEGMPAGHAQGARPGLTRRSTDCTVSRAGPPLVDALLSVHVPRRRTKHRALLVRALYPGRLDARRGRSGLRPKVAFECRASSGPFCGNWRIDARCGQQYLPRLSRYAPPLKNLPSNTE
ncbi:MAG: tRNA-dihydrouridine synthase [Sandaracinaceae bacterium]